MEGNDDICGKQNSEALSEIEVRKSLDSAADRLCDGTAIPEELGVGFVCNRLGAVLDGLFRMCVHLDN